MASEILKERRANGRLKWFAIVAALLMIFAGANAHLIYVAIQSQPDCMIGGANGKATAAVLLPAKPAC